MLAQIEDILYYPLKGVGGTSLAKTLLTKRGICHDRRYALAFGDSSDSSDSSPPAAAAWRPWETHHSLKNNAFLARLSAAITDENGEPLLHISFDGKPAVCGRPAHAAEQLKIETCLRQILDSPTAHLVDGETRPLWDEDGMSLTLLSAASVHALSELENAPLETTRFRANIIFSGAPPWREENFTGTAKIGAARLKLAGGVPRCAATLVNPQTAERDLKIPKFLHRQRGHMKMGLFAQVTTGGEIAIGQEIRFDCEST